MKDINSSTIYSIVKARVDSNINYMCYTYHLGV